MGDAENQIFSENLLRLLALHGKKQKEVAAEIGVSPQTFNTWCRGIALPRMGKLQLLADYFGLTKADLLDVLPQGAGEGDARPGSADCFGRDGGPGLIPFEVPDSAMEPRICRGDTVLIHSQGQFQPGDIIVASISARTGSSLVCRRIKYYAEGFMLLASNPAYDPLLFSGEGAGDGTVTFFGKVVELRAKL